MERSLRLRQTRVREGVVAGRGLSRIRQDAGGPSFTFASSVRIAAAASWSAGRGSC